MGSKGARGQKASGGWTGCQWRAASGDTPYHMEANLSTAIGLEGQTMNEEEGQPESSSDKYLEQIQVMALRTPALAQHVGARLQGSGTELSETGGIPCGSVPYHLHLQNTARSFPQPST